MSSSPIYIPPEGLRVRIQSYATSGVVFTFSTEAQGLVVGNLTYPTAGWWTFLHGSGNHAGRYAIKSQETGEFLFSRGSSPVVGTVKGDGQDEDNWFELEPGSGQYTDHFRLITSEGWKLACPWRTWMGGLSMLVNTALPGSLDSDQFFGFIWEDMKVDRVEFDLAAGVVGTATPIALVEEELPNDSDTEQEMDFAVNKGVTCSSTFEYSAGFTVTVGTEFSASVPLVAEASFKVEVSAESTWTWGKTTEYNSQYTATFPVKAAAHTAVRASAVVTKGTLNVPYTMHLSSKSSGVEVQTSGIWRGVSSWDFRFHVTNIDPKHLP